MYRSQLCVVQSLLSHRDRWGDMDLDIRPLIMQDEIGDRVLQEGLPRLRKLSMRHPIHDGLYVHPVRLALGKCPLLEDVTFTNTMPLTLTFFNMVSLKLFFERTTEPLKIISIWNSLLTAHNLRSLTLGVHRSDVEDLSGPRNIILPHLRNLHLTSLSVNFFRFVFEHLVAEKLSALTIVSHIDHVPGSSMRGIGIMVWNDQITATFRNFLSRSCALREFNFDFDTRIPNLYTVLSLLPDLTSLSWPLPPIGDCSSLRLLFDDAEDGRRLVSGSCPKLESMTFYPGIFDRISMASAALGDWLDMLESRWYIPGDAVDVARLRSVRTNFWTSGVPSAVLARLKKMMNEGLIFVTDEVRLSIIVIYLIDS